jgi:hypothetical protein
MKYISACVATVVALTVTAQAAVTLDFQADQLRNAAGVPLSEGALVVIVADTLRDGFSSLVDGGSLTINGILGGLDDRVIGKYDLSVWEGDGVFQNPGGAAGQFEMGNYTNWNTGDPLAIYWFPTLTVGDQTVLAGTAYGRFLGPTGSGGESWLTPTDNSPQVYTFFTTEGSTLGTGSFPANAGDASSTVSAVPEPSVSVLAMAGAMFAMLGRRRRKNRHP